MSNVKVELTVDEQITLLSALIHYDTALEAAIEGLHQTGVTPDCLPLLDERKREISDLRVVLINARTNT